MNPLRSAITGQVRKLVGSRQAAEAKAAAVAPGDPGLFGPSSVCWRVHGDFTSMMVGGVSALLLQMLHPGALAGVWDHSNFREDRFGRLRRTAQFIAGTTYGPTEEAERLIAHVRGIHDQVSGLTTDGRPYSANDPELLTWVHVAEVSRFLAAFLRYRDPRLSAADQDRYYDETALIARKLGATEVPRSRRAVEEYLRAVRPKLVCDARTREVADVLLTPVSTSPATAAAAHVVFAAGKDLLPPWAARMHGFAPSTVSRPAVQLGVRAIGAATRWALTDSAEARARRRTAHLVAAPSPALDPAG